MSFNSTTFFTAEATVDEEYYELMINFMYLEATFTGLLTLFGCIGMLLCGMRYFEESDVETRVTAFLVGATWLQIVCCCGSAFPLYIMAITRSMWFADHSQACYYWFGFACFSYVNCHIAFYGILYKRAQCSKSLLLGDQRYKQRYNLLRRIVLVGTLCSPIASVAMAAFLSQPINVSNAQGDTACRMVVDPVGGVVMIVLDSSLSVAYLLLFIVPLKKNIYKLSQTSEGPLAIQQKEFTTNIRRTTKRNLRYSTIQIGATFTSMMLLVIAATFNVPAYDSNGAKETNSTVLWISVFVCGDLLVMTWVTCHLTTAWVPRKCLKALDNFTTRRITPHTLPTAATSTGGLSEL